ncbi:MAG: RIP metalloprotease RseP [Alphaproteobacteria bacterium]|nr:RIP metalloprotease RseP [Alphaproteobacteria bacterium]
MDIVASAVGTGWTILTYTLAFLVVITVVVFIHELGHFLVARYFNVRVETFSIGFGRSLYAWEDSKGTRWKIGWLPFGGYVKFWGDENAASQPDQDRIRELARDPQAKDCFHFKPLYQRALVVVAGPAANFLLAIAIYMGLLMVIGETRVAPRIGEIQAGSAAERAGFQVGDLLLRIDDVTIEDFGDIRRYVILRDGQDMVAVVERAGQEVTLPVTPVRTEITDPMGNKMEGGLLGISPDFDESNITHVRYWPGTALVLAIGHTFGFAADTLDYIGRKVFGEGDVSQISGLPTIAKASGDAAAMGPGVFINLIAVLSISIGLINLFPIPMLDGGHLVYYAFEAVRGEPLGERTQEMGFRIGLALVLFLMVFATWNDLSKFGLF